MDRFVTREPRTGREYPEGNQMMACSATSNGTGNNITIPENIYYGGYGGEVQNGNVQKLGARGLVTHAQAYSPNVTQAQGQTGSSIDPRYLAAYAGNNSVYADNNAAYAQTIHSGNLTSPAAFNTFGSDYESRSFTGAETNNRNFNKTQANNYNFNRADANYSNFNRADANYQNFNRADVNYHNFNLNADAKIHNDLNRVDVNNHYLNRGQINNATGAKSNNLNSNATNMNNRNFNTIESNNHNFNRAEPSNNFNRAQINNQNFSGGRENNQNFKAAEASKQNFKGAEQNENKPFVQTKPNVASKNKTEIDTLKDEPEVQVKTRAEKLKELHKFGTRVYSGPVEKILKWHKSLQDIGVMVLYEIVGKCVNVRAGESCSKNLVVRDENGPAIQVVYYEIDFFLPDLKPPCTVRVIGRMMPGTSRFQAFNVRPATGDDLATLPRRAAVAAHHVAKLAKDYGIEVITLK